MAKAEKKTVTREVVKTEEVEVIRLELSREEADALQGLLNFVAGDPWRSRRGYTDAVSDALAEAGFPILRGPAYQAIKNGVSVGVMFADEDGLNL